ncbi:hypothetical protein FIBSPDRAFT_819638 [Athelia psychrophila]|uniref:TNT domain-containing protein n=1 Tax=Athelia psychrophila TaxID=1759441 RepID=A0A166PNC6_9AGAM|nr:hypothetical protein FIBSPDRAFT_800432 [Fibularhizoctonia sp. CBS 109695]KZP26271.1 hypothetical protein FIBSPDRAFT_819638 [Fibularhizoctonia sp. CBS 109695]
MRCSLAFAITALAAAAVASPIVPISSPIHLLDSEVNKCGSDYCAGTNNTKGNHYLCGDARLGPTKLPTKLPLSSEIYGYDRLGGLCPGEFLKKWYNATGGSYIYPEQNGFQLNTGNAPIDGNQTLAVGARIDRFGSEYGNFLSPAGAPYNQRALPPSNLDAPTTGPSYPYNYHVYEVIKEFDVLSGPIAPWFGQPGQGTQYEAYTNVMTLISQGYLKAVTLD